MCNGFVWDDTALILRDPLIRSWRLIPEGFNHFLFVDATASDFYRPIQRLSYTLDYAAFAFRPGPYHLTTVLWHSLAAVASLFFAEEFLLSFGIERRRSAFIALGVALVWAIHPVQSAAVVYVSGLADPLAATFGFVGLFFMLRAVRTLGSRNLHMDRDVETQPTGFNDASLGRAAWRELQTLLGLILIAAFFYWMLRTRTRSPAVFISLFFALIAYLPASGVVALNATAAEHWIYLPSAFFFLAVALEIAALKEKLAPRGVATSSVMTGVLALWFVFLGARTFVRTFDWKDQRTFLERTIAHGGDSARMLINLAGLELTEGKLEDAAVHLHTALQKKPDQPLAVINLAAVALKQNDFKLARQLITRATKMPLVDAEAYEYLAILENKENGKVDLIRMRLAARTGPPHWSIEKRYIQLLDQTDGTPAAINELLSCLQRQWYRAESWKLLSDLHAKLGHSTQAAKARAQARAFDVHLSESKLEN